MVLVRFPLVSTWINSIRKDKGRLIRLLVIIGLVIAFVYIDHTQSGTENQEVSDWLYNRDPLLRLTRRINASLHESSEAVIYVATGILFAQYLLYISLIVKYIGKGNLILVEVFTGWIAGVLIKYVMPLPRSSHTINYAADLPYPLQKYVDDISFSTSTFMVMVCARRLVRSKSDHLGKFMLWTVVGAVVFFLCITCNTYLDALVPAVLVSIGASWFRAWLAVRLKKRSNTSLRAIFNVMHLEATRSLQQMKKNASGAWKQMKSVNPRLNSGGHGTSNGELDVRFEEDFRGVEINETGSVVYDPRVGVESAPGTARTENTVRREDGNANDAATAHAIESKEDTEFDDDQMSLHSVHSDDIHSIADDRELIENVQHAVSSEEQ